MRKLVFLLILAFAIPCRAEDPLETLNTVEDTLKTMEQVLKMRSTNRQLMASAASGGAIEKLPQDERLYFVADEPLGDDDWVPVRPCTEDVAMMQGDADSCVGQADGYVALGANYWKSRPATSGDLRVGALVVARDQGGAWFVTRITSTASLYGGFVSVTAPFQVSVRGLRIVE